jgi:hypothetical protein
MSKHTPGPWSVGGKYAHRTVLVNARGESIASGGNNRAVVGEELEASLILAAAAPDLLEALQTVWNSTAVLNHLDADGIDMIEAAIAKATGSAK